MTRYFFGPMVALMLCCVVPVIDGAEKGRGGERQPGRASGEGTSEGREGRESPGRVPAGEARRGSGNSQSLRRKSPGGAWSEDSRDAHGQSGTSENRSGAEGAAAATHRNESQATGAQGAAAAPTGKNNQPQATGAEGAAAGAAAAKNKQPQYSGEEGAAAGAAVAKNNQPQATGAEGAAAGAAVAKNNQPQYSGAQGAAAGAAVANRNSPQFSGAQGAAGYAAVRNSFDHPDLYGQQWYGEHQGVWAPTTWTAGAAWAPTAPGTIASACGYDGGTPVSYNYGTNVVCRDGNVMVDGQNVGTAEEFSQQASDLAETGAAAATSDTDQWMPLGVFAMVRNANQHPQMILQLAINQQGVLRGNFTDEVTDHTMPVQGAVDPQTQRMAWTVGDNKNTVMEVGLSNLTEGDAAALLHKNGKTQRWLLVRLSQPRPGKS